MKAPRPRITPEIQESCAHPRASAYPAERSRLQPHHAPHRAPAEVFHLRSFLPTVPHIGFAPPSAATQQERASATR
jgi:hypothetical protein